MMHKVYFFVAQSNYMKNFTSSSNMDLRFVPHSVKRLLSFLPNQNISPFLLSFCMTIMKKKAGRDYTDGLAETSLPRSLTSCFLVQFNFSTRCFFPACTSEHMHLQRILKIWRAPAALTLFKQHSESFLTTTRKSYQPPVTHKRASRRTDDLR